MKRAAALDTRYLSETLCRLRRRAGLTQKSLAEKAGVHPASISRYESGKLRLGRVNLKKICNVVGCSPAQFFEEAWQISEQESGLSPETGSGGADPSAAFPKAELEQIYDESAGDTKKLYMRTCRALFDAIREAVATAPHRAGR